MSILLLKSAAAKLVAAGAAGLGGYELWRHFYPKLQSLRSVSASGHPIQTVVPVGQKVVQLKLAKSQSAVPLPPNNGSSATFTPPPPVSPTKLSSTEATVITPTGAANLSVDNVGDIQRALNTLGQQPPLATDGINGPLTQGGIASFESAHGLPVDGQPSAGLRTALQTALSRVAGTQAHIGQSIPVQAAGAPGATLAMNLATSPAGQALVQSGLAGIANAFSDTSDSDASADTASDGTPTKDVVVQWQRVLNLLGSKPPLDESGVMDPETIAATKAFQITLGLVADGVPGPKTATAAAVMAVPGVATAVIPSIPKAADHVATVASDAPIDTKAALTAAATTLAASAANPAPTDAQTHASTASAQAATASSAAPTPAIAAPLAAASSSLASASTTPAPDPTHLANASAALSTAAAAASGTTSAPSIASAADHVAAAAAAPDVATQSDHLNAAAAHLANAAAGTPSSGAVAANGEFGWDFFGIRSWWANRQHGFWPWHRALHPAYRPPVPVMPPGPPAVYGSELGMGWSEFGYGGLYPMSGQGGYGQGGYGQGGYGQGGYGRHHHHHHNPYGQQPQGMPQPQSPYGYSAPPPPPPPQGDFGAPPPPPPPQGGGRPYVAPPPPQGGLGGGLINIPPMPPAPPPPQGGFFAPPAPMPMAYGQGGADAQYWANRQQSMGGFPGGFPGGYPPPGGFDRRWFDRHGRYGQPWGQPGYPQVPPVQFDPNAYQAPDPNAVDPSQVQDPNAATDGGAGD